MDNLQRLQEMAGIYVDESASQMYLYVIVEPSTGELTTHGQGTLTGIIRALEVDSENSKLADVIKHQTADTMRKSADGRLAFQYDGHHHVFLPI